MEIFAPEKSVVGGHVASVMQKITCQEMLHAIKVASQITDISKCTLIRVNV